MLSYFSSTPLVVLAVCIVLVFVIMAFLGGYMFCLAHFRTSLKQQLEQLWSEEVGMAAQRRSWFHFLHVDKNRGHTFSILLWIRQKHADAHTQEIYTRFDNASNDPDDARFNPRPAWVDPSL